MRLNPDTGEFEEDSPGVVHVGPMPANPQVGDMWADTETNKVYTFRADGLGWDELQAIPPANHDLRNYSYVESINEPPDTKGFTGGLVGFTSAAEDVEALIKFTSTAEDVEALIKKYNRGETTQKENDKLQNLLELGKIKTLGNLANPSSIKYPDPKALVSKSYDGYTHVEFKR